MAGVVVRETDCLGLIGATSGLVWEYLSQNDPVSVTRIVKSVEAPRDLVLQAVGWLAREGKLEIVETNRGKLVTLATEEQIRLAG